jgi:hypothetical protein
MGYPDKCHRCGKTSGLEIIYLNDKGFVAECEKCLNRHKRKLNYFNWFIFAFNMFAIYLTIYTQNWYCLPINIVGNSIMVFLILNYYKKR